MKILISLITVMMFSTTVFAAGPVLNINPQKTKAKVGSTVSVDIMAQDLPVSEGGGVTLRFDPSVVQVTGVSVNTAQWNFASSPGVIDNTKGEVSDIWVSSFSGVSGNAKIATNLQAIKRGKSPLRLQESALNPFASAGNRLSVSFVNGSLAWRENRKSPLADMPRVLLT